MAGFAPPNRTAQVDPKTKIDEKVDYSNLRCPYPYEEIHREATMSLEPELFEGFRLDYNKKMNHKFSLRHSISMGPTPFGYYESQIRKTPSANYEFGVNFTDQKLMLDGKLMTDGTVTARVKCDLTDNCTIKTYALEDAFTYVCVHDESFRHDSCFCVSAHKIRASNSLGFYASLIFSFFKLRFLVDTLYAFANKRLKKSE